MLRKSFSSSSVTSSKALLSSFASTAVVSCTATLAAAARGGFQYYSPKSDIPLGKFEFNAEYNNMRARMGRVPDHNVENYRKMYYRIDEMCRRQERFVQKQGFFFLPALDYPSYKGVQPLYSPEQLRLHYGRHHRAYVTKLNELIAGTSYEGRSLDEIIRRSEDDPAATAIFNNAAQHYNHMFFWKSIKPFGVNIPPELKAALEEQFGSVEDLTKAMSDKAMTFFGSGWLWLAFDTNTLRFEIITTANAKTLLTQQGIAPLIVMDLWEHSWAKDYENVKAEYVANYWKVVDWHWAERNWKRAQGKEYHDMVWN